MNIYHKVEGCFLGVAIGDALGVPVEMMTGAEILEKTAGVGITGFSKNIQHRVKDTINLPIGSTSDDWELTESIIRSLIRSKEFNILDMALSHISSYELSTFGWGGTTRDGIKELKEYIDSRGDKGRSPFVDPLVKPNRGNGNGIAMKIAPIAILNFFSNKELELDANVLAYQVSSIGRLTHSDKRSWAAAYAICLLLFDNLYITDFEYSKELILNNLNYLIKLVKKFEVIFPCNYDDKPFSFYLSKLCDESLLFGPISNLSAAVGTGCNCIESVIFAIAVFLRNPYNFRVGALEAINNGSIGLSDSDTICSIVCSLIGAAVGVEGIPIEWIEFNYKFSGIKILAKEFVDMFNK